jgi:hypothetical protein
MKSKNETPSTILLNGKPYEVTPGGSLGLLALGNIGVRAWKKAAAEYNQEEKNKAPKNEKK